MLFDSKIPDDKIFAVRAATIKYLTDKNKTRFLHQHLDNEKLIYRYPLVQFKNFTSNTGVIALNEAADELLPLLGQFPIDFMLNDEKNKLNVVKIQMDKFFPEFSSDPIQYKIENWMALNSKNYENFKIEKSLINRTLALEKILKNNIVSFLKALCPQLKNKINLSIDEIHSHKIMKYKNVSFSTFSLSFSVNLKLPNYIGLGKASSVGFGKIKKIAKSKSVNADSSIKCDILINKISHKNLHRRFPI